MQLSSDIIRIMKGFSDIEQSAWGGLLETYWRLNQLIEADLQTNHNISHVEFEVLLRLEFAPNHRMRIQDLASQSILTRSGMSRAIERLEKAGFVKRAGACEDRRGFYAVLTEEGKSRFEGASKKHVELVRQKFLSHFTEKELKTMGGYWQKLNDGSCK